jgi:hypothetical protein
MKKNIFAALLVGLVLILPYQLLATTDWLGSYLRFTFKKGGAGKAFRLDQENNNYVGEKTKSVVRFFAKINLVYSDKHPVNANPALNLSLTYYFKFGDYWVVNEGIIFRGSASADNGIVGSLSELPFPCFWPGSLEPTAGIFLKKKKRLRFYQLGPGVYQSDRLEQPVIGSYILRAIEINYEQLPAGLRQALETATEGIPRLQ